MSSAFLKLWMAKKDHPDKPVTLTANPRSGAYLCNTLPDSRFQKSLNVGMTLAFGVGDAHLSSRSGAGLVG